MDDPTALFGVQHHVTAGQECARAVVVFIYGLALMRVSGRRTFGKWSAIDVIVSITAGSALSRALTGSAPLGGTMAATAVLVGLHWLVGKLAAHNRHFAGIVEGRSLVLADDGRLDDALRLRHSISHGDLAEALHRKNLDDLAQVGRITLEPSGKLNVSPKA